MFVQRPPLWQTVPARPGAAAVAATWQKSKVDEHVSPLYDAGHAQEKTPIGMRTSVEESVQVPPLAHGLLAHSSKSIAHDLPTQPVAQWHTKGFDLSVSPECWQTPPCSHGLSVQMSSSQVDPLKPLAHSHKNVVVEKILWSLHVPPWWHGVESHTWVSVAQFVPL